MSLVYAFLDHDGVIRYVGQTVESLTTRVRGHLRDCETPITKWHTWLAEYVERHGVPRVIVLERPPREELDAREQHHIKANEATVYNTAHVCTTEEARQAKAERDAERRRQADAARHPCRQDVSFSDEEWAGALTVTIDAEWDVLRRAVHVMGPNVYHSRKGVERTHATLARLALLGRDEDADRVLVAAMLSDWSEEWAHCYRSNRCFDKAGPFAHMSRGTADGLDAIHRLAVKAAGDALPGWHWKVTQKTDACGLLGALAEKDEGHLVLGPQGFAAALVSAARGYAARVVGNLIVDFGEPILAPDEEEKILPRWCERRRKRMADAVRAMNTPMPERSS